jgi:excisionase family DNA binding protein
MDPDERQRRHQEKWMKEVLDGLARIHQVLHSLAMDVHELMEHSERQRPAAGLGETQSSESKLLSIKELAEYLGISSSTAYGLRHGEPGLVPVQIGKRVYFRRQDVDRWLDRLQRVEASAQTRYSGRPFVINPIGSSVPASSEPPKRNHCNGSGLEPARLSRYSGRGVCPVCGDDPILNKDGRLRKHLARWY